MSGPQIVVMKPESRRPRAYYGLAPDSALAGATSEQFRTAPAAAVTVDGYYERIPLQGSLRYGALINLGPDDLYFRFPDADGEGEWGMLAQFSSFDTDMVPHMNAIDIGAETGTTAYWQLLTTEVDG